MEGLSSFMQQPAADPAGDLGESVIIVDLLPESEISDETPNARPLSSNHNAIAVGSDSASQHHLCRRC